MHSHARTSAKIDATLSCRSLLPLMSFSGIRAAKFSKKMSAVHKTQKTLTLFSRHAFGVRTRPRVALDAGSLG
jgi:hypothetical protein